MDDANDAAARLAAVRENIARAAKSASRDPAGVELIAVSKTMPPEAVAPLIAAGQASFGENRVQEAGGKWPALRAASPELRLHLVGQLQSNKAADAAQLFDAIHSVDRASLVEALAKACDAVGRTPQLFVQVNIGDEPQKGGCAIAELPALLAQARAAGLAIDGLMCVPPADIEAAPFFALAAKLARDNGLTQLSMGMSADYETAVMLGATHVRVGTALFGDARMSFAALLFDFDGVLIESEAAGNIHLAETLTALGHATSAEQAMTNFMGLAGADFRAAVERWIGRPLPPAFEEARRAEDERCLREGVAEVVGAVQFVRSLPPELPVAVVSSSSTRWLHAHLAHLGLADRFGAHVYSGHEHVARGKPAPDIYLHAAAELGADIRRCVIIEDLPVGATGAVASGAYVIGLAAGAHCGPDHGDKLRAIGVAAVARDFDEVAQLIAAAGGVVTGDQVRALALALPGVTEYPHFDRAAFKARVTFATLGGGTVNLKLVPEQAAMLIEAEPDTFLSLGGWTRQGYVGVRLDRIDDTRLELLLRDAWRNGAPKGATLD